jgi:hypothetical protein
MRWLTVAGVVVFSTGAAFGAYVVELDGGDRMTVDSYWQDTDRTHLVRGGVDMSVPRGRVVSIRAASEGDETAGVGRTSDRTAPAPARRPADDDDAAAELDRARNRIERHAVRNQIALSVARTQHDKKAIRRLEKVAERTERRHAEVMRALNAR